MFDAVFFTRIRGLLFFAKIFLNVLCCPVPSLLKLVPSLVTHGEVLGLPKVGMGRAGTSAGAVSGASPVLGDGGEFRKFLCMSW